MSANQIAEYLSANPANRRRIRTEAKFPAKMITTRYEDARRAVANHLTGDANALSGTLTSLKRRMDDDGVTDYKKQNCKLSTDAIDGFQGAEAKMDAGSGVTFKSSPLHGTKLNIEGVKVSVALDVVAQKIGKTEAKSVGGVVLVFSKDAGKAKDVPARCKAVAMLAHEVMKLHVKGGEKCDPTLCMAIDVFNAKIYRAKKQQKHLYASVESSCEEVSILWPSIKEPKGYDGPPVTN